MSDIIHLLPDSVANQIAAGEVIQRPASVIKELVENAVDAGATEIRIFIKDAGRTLIQVVDNGKGMSVTDARMAFERHATSKISAATDLFTLATMGFRGEALPSICAISQVELRTRTENDQIGTCLKINCSKVESQEPCVCDRGANIMVKNIFCNLPARRKFLKSDSVELANIMREFERLALVNNHIHLSIDTGNKQIDLRPGTFKHRIGDIWKNNLNLQLIPIEVETSVVKISGFVSRPEFARKRNPLQYLIANGRNMRHPYFHKAILSSFSPLIASDTQPCYFLKFEVDPATIDVNIHPTKNEIKFENEQEIWRILSAAVRAALGKFAAVPSIDFESDPVPATAGHAPDSVDSPQIGADPGYNPFSNGSAEGPALAPFNPFADAPRKSGSPSRYAPQTPHRGGNKAPGSWTKLYNDFMAGVQDSDSGRQDEETPRQLQIESPESPEEAVTTPFCIQHDGKYIITSTAQGLMIIDQHRAHVRILYEDFIEIARSASGVSQQIMFPDVLSLDASQQLAFEGVEDELTRLGYRFHPCGDGKWSIEGIPSMLLNADPKDVIMRVIDSVSDDSINYGNEATPAESMLQRVALVMARSAAIKRGKQLTAKEMESLVSRLFTLSDIRYTPNGNPIITLIDTPTLASYFKSL